MISKNDQNITHEMETEILTKPETHIYCEHDREDKMKGKYSQKVKLISKYSEKFLLRICLKIQNNTCSRTQIMYPFCSWTFHTVQKAEVDKLKCEVHSKKYMV